jgi:hypothetical protein
MSNTIRFAGDFKFQYVRLASFNTDNVLDITNLIGGVDVYESIWSPFLTLDITVLDSLGLSSKFPIIGEEFIEMDLRGPDGITGLPMRQFYIYKLSDVTIHADRSKSYILKCISTEALVDMNLKLSKSFSGQPSDIVREILIDKNIESKKPLITQESKNKIKYISNYWSPIQNIQFLCKKAVSKEKDSPSYIFFETKRGFNFVTLDSLISKSSVGEFSYTINPRLKDIEQKAKIIDTLYVDESFDYITKLKSGSLGMRSIEVDSLYKNYKYSYYDFVSGFSSFARLNEFPINSENVTRRLNAKMQYRISSDEVEEGFTKRQTEISSITSMGLQIEVPGNFNLAAGDVIDLFVYADTISTGNVTDMKKMLDMVLSGRYLVTSIKHTIDREKHSMSLIVNKDSLIKR